MLNILSYPPSDISAHTGLPGNIYTSNCFVVAAAESVLPELAYLFAISGSTSAQHLLKASIFGLVARFYCHLFNKLLLLKVLFLVIIIETLSICNSKSHDAN